MTTDDGIDDDREGSLGKADPFADNPVPLRSTDNIAADFFDHIQSLTEDDIAHLSDRLLRGYVESLGPVMRAADWRDAPIPEPSLTAEDIKDAARDFVEGKVKGDIADKLCNLILVDDPSGVSQWLCAKVVEKALDQFIHEAK